MEKGAERAQRQGAAADLIRRGYPHGKRMTKGLDGMPSDRPGSTRYHRYLDRLNKSHAQRVSK